MTTQIACFPKIFFVWNFSKNDMEKFVAVICIEELPLLFWKWSWMDEAKL
jgi:hypothetical protein